ncbi:hypothetical protein [Corynebacterium falsenii]|uniref:hypothetical protein n=1 Tax=Corynebacterium falsenii TaxID=108486 RepID=UPI001DFF2605|nr:hypothetical protein [Corynebacterium falsenii]HJF12350.1 hypothetical protein [Corynebacterium falsenii]
MVGNKLPFGSGGWSQKKLPVSKLDLDLMNARFRDDAENQTQALEFMLAVAGEKCLELLKDLCMSGDLNPSDLPIVVAEGNRYRVLEGNRRLACLKIWKKPGLLDSISEDLRNEYKRRFESVIQKAPYAPPNEIKVVVVDSIEDADGWIDKKHGRGKGGASTVEWNAFEKDRRQYRQTNKKTRAFSFVDMLNAEYGDELEMMQSLSVLLKGQYTILERILNNPVMCDDLGVRYESDGRTRLDQGAKSMRPFFVRLLDDLAQKRQDSRSLRKKEETSKYLTLLREETLGNENLSSANANKPPEPTKNDLAGGAEANSYPLKGSENQSKVKGAAPVKKPRKRKPTVRVLQGVSMDGFSGKTAKLVEDTAVLSVDKNPVIVAILLRG